MLSIKKYNFPSVKRFTSIKIVDSHRFPEQPMCFIGLSKIKNSDYGLRGGYNPNHSMDNLINVEHVHTTDSETKGAITPFLNRDGDAIGVYNKQNTDEFYVFIKKELPPESNPSCIKRICGRIVHYFCKLNSLEPFERIPDKMAPSIQEYANPWLSVFQHSTFLNSIIGVDKKKIVIKNAQKYEKGVTEFIQYNSTSINVYNLINDKDLDIKPGVFQTFIVPPGYNHTFDDPIETFNPVIYDLANVENNTTPFKTYKDMNEDLIAKKLTSNNSTKTAFVKTWEHVISTKK